MGIFKKSGLTICDKILKFANFENRGTNIWRDILHVMQKILPIFLLLMVNDRFAYF